MIVTVIRCDRCKKLVDSPPPISGEMTAGYYSNWKDFVPEEHICDNCMWNDPAYIKVYGVQPCQP